MNIINEGRKCGRTAIPGNKTDKRDAYFHPFLSLFMTFFGPSIFPRRICHSAPRALSELPAPQTRQWGKVSHHLAGRG